MNREVMKYIVSVTQIFFYSLIVSFLLTLYDLKKEGGGQTFFHLLDKSPDHMQTLQPYKTDTSVHSFTDDKLRLQVPH